MTDIVTLSNNVNFLVEPKRLEDAITAVRDMLQTLANVDGSPVLLPKYAFDRVYLKDALGSFCEALRRKGLEIQSIEKAMKVVDERAKVD